MNAAKLSVSQNISPRLRYINFQHDMPQIESETIINASIEICFDLSRSIALHKISTAATKENSIDGKRRGSFLNNKQAAHIMKRPVEGVANFHSLRPRHRM